MKRTEERHGKATVFVISRDTLAAKEITQNVRSSSVSFSLNFIAEMYNIKIIIELLRKNWILLFLSFVLALSVLF